jgi:hypothetical protein
LPYPELIEIVRFLKPIDFVRDIWNSSTRPSVRFREDGTCLCTGTLRLEELGTSGTVFKTYLPFEAYGKVGEQVGEWQAGDVCTLQGKVFWRKYHNKKR